MEVPGPVSPWILLPCPDVSRPMQPLDKCHAMSISIGMLHWRRWGFQPRFPSSITLIHDSVRSQTRGPHGLQVDVAFPCLLGLQQRKWGGSTGLRRSREEKTPSNSVSEMSLERPQPSRGASTPKTLEATATSSWPWD